MVGTNSKLAVVTLAASALLSSSVCEGLSTSASSRRDVLGSMLGGGAAAMSGLLTNTQSSYAAESTDIDSFLRTGGVAMPMGVSGQAGKAKPETGVLIREGTDISRDPKSGNVLAEILVQKSGAESPDNLMAVVASFQSPWPLGMY